MTHTFELLEPRLMVYKLYPPAVGTGKTVYLRSVSAVEDLKRREAMFSIHHDLLRSHPDMMKFASMVEFEVRNLDIKEALRGKERREKYPRKRDRQ